MGSLFLMASRYEIQLFLFTVRLAAILEDTPRQFGAVTLCVGVMHYLST